MSNPVQLTLPLSATALRLGAAFLTQLADQTETIYAELTDMNPFYAGLPNREGATDIYADAAASVVQRTEATCTLTRVEDGTLDKTYRVETPEEKQFRLHGNVASAGGDTTGPLNAATVFGGAGGDSTPVTRVTASGGRITTDPKPGATDGVAPVAPQAPSPDAPVAPTAPASTTPAAPNPSSGIVTDKAGLPHDKRIHSTPPSINKGDGLWRAKRGRDEIEAKRIEAELLAAMQIPAPAAPVTDAPKPDPTPSVTADPAPVAPQAPTAPAAPTASAPASTTPKNLGELMIWAQAQIAAGKIASLDAVRAAAVEAGLAALPLLGARPDLVPVVYAKLGGV